MSREILIPALMLGVLLALAWKVARTTTPPPAQDDTFDGFGKPDPYRRRGPQ